jgi:hypothetical protein
MIHLVTDSSRDSWKARKLLEIMLWEMANHCTCLVDEDNPEAASALPLQHSFGLELEFYAGGEENIGIDESMDDILLS